MTVLFLTVRFSILFVTFTFLWPSISPALSADEILVVVNKNAWDSVKLGKYYMKKRGVPEENLLKLWVTEEEQCSREEYHKEIVLPVRAYLEKREKAEKISCLVLMHGMPLKVAPPVLTEQEKEELEDLETQGQALRDELQGLDAEDERRKNLKNRLEKVQSDRDKLKKVAQAASLDSEIALVMNYGYPLSGRLPNPHFLGYEGKNVLSMPADALMVSRLDGPSKEVVQRIIDDSFQAEQEGLKGTAYFDARWAEPKEKKTTGYAFYDQSIHRAARAVKKSAKMPVKVEDTQNLFQPGDCPEAALYCGWYKLAHYVDAFDWQTGAVGYHIASSECSTLRGQSSQVWCKRMLEEGIAATLGPVSEPYIQAFPPPEMFFGLLLSGKYTLAECFAMSNPFLSWKMVLIGDPLYRPFREQID